MGLLRFTATVSLLQLPFLVTHAPVDSLRRSLSPLIVLLFEIGERAGRRIHGKVGCSDLADARGFNFRKKAMCPSLLRVGQFRRPTAEQCSRCSSNDDRVLLVRISGGAR
jgi:hypothetical protein